MVAAAAAGGVRIVHDDRKALGRSRRMRPSERRRLVLTAAGPRSTQAFADAGVHLAQEAVVGKVRRGHLEQVRVIDRTCTAGPGQTGHSQAAGTETHLETTSHETLPLRCAFAAEP